MKIDVFKEVLQEFDRLDDEFDHRIVCGAAAFNTLRAEIERIEHHYNPLTMTTEYGYMGIPLTIVQREDRDEDQEFQIISTRRGLPFNYDPFKGFRVKRYIDDEIESFVVDDIVDAYIQPDWTKYSPWAKSQNESKEISDDDLMAVLNGGGYQAVKA